MAASPRLCENTKIRKVHRIKTPLRGRNTCPFAGKDSVKENRKVVFRVPLGQHLSNPYRVSVPKGSPNKKDAEGADPPPRREGGCVKGEPFAGAPFAFHQGSIFPLCTGSAFLKVHQIKKTPKASFLFGEPSGIRTPGPLIKSQMLCRLS